MMLSNYSWLNTIKHSGNYTYHQLWLSGLNFPEQFWSLVIVRGKQFFYLATACDTFKDIYEFHN